MRLLAVGARKLILMTFATVCIVLGLLTVWTPIPTGLPLLALGIVVAVSVSTTARRLLRSVRARSASIDRGLVFVETRTHRNMATMLRRTRPLGRKIEAKAALHAASEAMKNKRTRQKREN